MQTKIISFRGDILPLKNVLYRLALRITLSHEDAEDVVQDTMMKLWNKRDQWPAIDNIAAYATTVCRNLALDKARSASADNVSLEETREERLWAIGQGQDTSGGKTGIPTPLSSQPTPYEQTAQRDRIDMVRRIIDSLPEKQRSCIQLRDFEGMSYKEIASILGISEEQVKVNIFRARQTIKKKFQEHEL